MVVGSKVGVPGDGGCLSVRSEYVVRDWTGSIVSLMARSFLALYRVELSVWRCCSGDEKCGIERIIDKYSRSWWVPDCDKGLYGSMVNGDNIRVFRYFDLGS